MKTNSVWSVVTDAEFRDYMALQRLRERINASFKDDKARRVMLCLTNGRKSRDQLMRGARVKAKEWDTVLHPLIRHLYVRETTAEHTSIYSGRIITTFYYELAARGKSL